MIKLYLLENKGGYMLVKKIGDKKYEVEFNDEDKINGNIDVMEKILEEEVNQIINSFKDKYGKLKQEFEEKFGDEAINWNDVKCSCVKKRYVIEIKEADTNAEEFREYIKRELTIKGFLDVEVITYW
jgi:glutathione peroxidase-family protein